MSYTRLSAEDVVLGSDIVSTPVWSNNSETISGSNLVTSSKQVGGLSGEYYLDAYYSASSGSVVQFTVTYADRDGSGSMNYNDSIDGKSPSRTIYGQYRSLVLGDEESEFKFKGFDSASAGFFALSIDRARYKESLMIDSSSFELTLSGSASRDIIIDSEATDTLRYLDSGRVFELKDKSTGSGRYTKSFGYFLPDIGTILVNVEALSGSGIVNTTDTVIRYSASLGSSSLENNKMFLNLIKSFKLRSQETVTSNYVFVRAKNSQFNYSVNPSNITSTGELRHDIMINQPETYITSVGLYNDANDLLAVAKLSRPLSKNFNKEALIRIKLDY